jgi:hypothetical protein
VAKKIYKWFVSAYDQNDRCISPKDLNVGQQHFASLDDAQTECHRLLQRFNDPDGPEPSISYCNILVAVGKAERQVVETVATRITPLDDGAEIDDNDSGTNKNWN